MINRNLISIIAAVSFIGLSGCLNEPKEENYALVAALEDNSAKDIVKEVSQMGQAFEFKNFTAGLAKTSSVDAAQENELNLSLKPWAYINNWWIRSGEITASDNNGASGFLKGSDEVQFKTSSGIIVQFPIIQNASSGTVIHEAQLYLEGTRGAYWDIGREFSLTGTITESGEDSILTMNGTLSQYLKAENAAQTQEIHVEGTAQAADVTWKRTNGTWGTPLSGTINLESNWKKIVIVFDTGKAHVNIENKINGNKNSFDVIHSASTYEVF